MTTSRSWLPLLIGFAMLSPLAAGEFSLVKDGDDVKVMLDGELFTEYRTSTGPKPILWPIIGPTGERMTRAYPMEKIEGERQDHPHHRSFWFTHGNVNGIDFWAETPGHGTTKHLRYAKLESGSPARIVTENAWLDPDGKEVLQDTRTLTFTSGDGWRAVDFDITFKATAGEVVWGDTKEGSMGVRIPTSMDVDKKEGGTIVTSEGVKDKAAWGTRAPWVDYVGPVKGETVGVAMMNHPSSFRYPSYWHVRTYGLFAANPFGLHHFLGDNKQDGSYTMKPGETMTLNYRIVFHEGDTEQAGIAEMFKKYAAEKK